MVVKILSYNIHKGRAFFSRKKIWSAIDELVHLVKPDIIFLQEFLKDDDSEKLLEKFADGLWPHKSVGQNATVDGFEYGNAILSKYAFEKTSNTNISTNSYERRGLLHGKITVADKYPLHLFCTHLDLTANGRYKQLKKIEDFVSKEANAKEDLILAGDFNDWNFEIHKKIKSDLLLEEVFENIKGILVPTSPSILPVLALDRIYYRGIKPVTALRVFDRKFRFLSDHLPLVAEVKIGK
jgi:endonuclease/exonuclease/phosphatase family metal-dependent hydrolase